MDFDLRLGLLEVALFLLGDNHGLGLLDLDLCFLRGGLADGCLSL